MNMLSRLMINSYVLIVRIVVEMIVGVFVDLCVEVVVHKGVEVVVDLFLLPAAMNHLSVRNNDIHHYNTRQKLQLHGVQPTHQLAVRSFSNRSVQS